MSTQFDDSFVNGDIIEAEHVKQVFIPIKDLESGAAFYREASGTGAPYVVDFTATPGVKSNFISTTAYDADNDLQPGQIITFKANVNSPASASLQLILEDGSSGTNSSSFPLNAGNSQVGADQILTGQIVVAVYNDQSGGRFDVSSVAAAPGSSSLDDLSDVAISSPAGGDIMLYNGTSNQFENGTLSSAGIVQQSRAVNVSSPLTGGGDLSADVSVGIQQASGSQDGYLSSTDHAAFSAKQDALGGSGDVPGLTAELANKSDVGHTHSAADITSGTLAVERGGTGADLSATGGTGQVLKQSTSGGAVTVGALAASDMPTGIDPAKLSPGTVDSTEFGYLNGVTGAIQTQIDGKASVSHTHSISEITSGTLPLDQGGTGSDLSATGGTGQFLKQSTSGGNVTVGALSAGEMPSGIDAAKVSSGNVSNTEFDYLDGVTNPIQTQLDGKAASSHTHTASEITDFEQAVASSLSASEWGHFPLLDSDIVASNLADTDIPLGVRNAGDQLDRNMSGRVEISEGLYVVTYAIACEIDSGGPLEVGLFEYSGMNPVEESGSARASYGDTDVHGAVVGEAIVAVPSGQTRELGLRTGSQTVNGKIVSGKGFFKIAKLNGGVAANGQTNALNDLSDVATNSPQPGDLFSYDGTVFTNQTPASARTSLGLEIGSDVQAHGALLDSLQGLSSGLAEGQIATDGSSIILKRTNLSAIAAPSASDNFSAGWSVGSTWLYSGVFYLCTGDGTWVQVYPAAVKNAYLYVGCPTWPNQQISSDGYVSFPSTNRYLEELDPESRFSLSDPYIVLTKPGLYRLDYQVTVTINSTSPEFLVGIKKSSESASSSARQWCQAFRGLDGDNYASAGHRFIQKTDTTSEYFGAHIYRNPDVSTSGTCTVCTAGISATYLGPTA